MDSNQEDEDRERSRRVGLPVQQTSHTDDDHAKLLLQKEMEIRQLRGKIKGYETLGELYKEMRQKSNLYKMAYDDTLKKLTELYKLTQEGRIDTESQDELENFLSSLNHFLDDPHRSIIQSLGQGADTAPVSTAPQTGYEDNPQFSLSMKPIATCAEEEAPPSTEMTPLTAAAESNESSDVSFVDVQPASSDKSPSFTIVSPSTSNKFSPGVANDNNPFSLPLPNPKVNLSEQLQKLCEICQSITHEKAEEMSLPSVPEATSLTSVVHELMRLTMEVLKKEREERIKKVFVDNVVEEIENLKGQMTAKDIKINQLSVEANHLRTKIQSLTVTSGPQHSEAADAQTGSSDWEHVQKQQPDDLKYVQLTSQLAEKEKVSVELEKANHMWEKHSEEMALKHRQQVAALEENLLACRLEVEECQQAHERSEAALREELTATRERQEQAEACATQARDQLEALQQQMTGPWPAESSSSRIEREVAELHRKVRAGSDLDEEQSVSLNSAPIPFGERNLVTEIQVLRQQVTIYKDDFERERKEHGKVMNSLKATRGEMRSLQEQLTHAKTQLQKSKRELKTVKDEKVALQGSLRKKSDQVQTLRATVSSMTRTPSQPIYGPVSPTWQLPGEQSPTVMQPPPPPTYPTAPPPAEMIQPASPNFWNCLNCTYSNVPQRIICEMCGARAPHYPAAPSQSRDNYLVHRGMGQGYDVCDTQPIRPLTPTDDDLVIDKASNI